MLEDSQRARIHRHRIGLALSPEQYAIRVGVSNMTVRRVEQGYTPQLATQEKFAQAMGVTREDLFGLVALPARAVLA